MTRSENHVTRAGAWVARHEAIFRRAPVLLQDFGRDRRGQVDAFEQVEVEVLDPRERDGPEVEWEVAGAPALGEAPLFLGRRLRAARPASHGERTRPGAI